MERTSKLVGRPAVRCIACRRCGMDVEVQGGASSVTLHYDLDVWRQSKCCCPHLDGPSSCCSFLELERAVCTLPFGHEPLSAPSRQPSMLRYDTTPSLWRCHPCEGGDIRIPALYLFESTTREKLAVGTDETGCSIPQIAGGHGWLLRREIKPNELPADVVLTAYKQGFCILDEDRFDSGSEFEPDKGSTKP